MQSFNEKCYSLLRKVPKGKVTTYKEIAKALKTRAYRAVGNAMKNNPYVSGSDSIVSQLPEHAQKSPISDTPDVPCHRVVKSDGSIGGFKGKTTGKTISEKIKILEKEGIMFEKNKIKLKNFEKVLFKF